MTEQNFVLWRILKNSAYMNLSFLTKTLHQFKHLELHPWSKSGMLERSPVETQYFCAVHTAEERQNRYLESLQWLYIHEMQLFC